MSYIATSATQQHGSVRDLYSSGRTYQPSSGMALTIVFLVCLGLAWTDGFQSNSTDIVTSLQERLSLENLSSCDSISLITEVLVREIEVRAKHQAEVERRITDHQAEVERRITEHQAEDERRNKEQRTGIDNIIKEQRSELENRSTAQRVVFDKRITAQRSELEGEIVKLQSQLANGTVGPAIAFFARARSSQEGLSNDQKINFSDMLTNIGGGYNKDTSTFSCPVKGVYQFVVNILTRPGKMIETELMAAGVSRMKIYSSGETHYGTGTSSALLELQAGDEVYVHVHKSYDKDVYGGDWSTFNGHLVHTL